MEKRIKKLEDRVADQWALCILAILMTGAAMVTGFFSMQVAASKEWNAVQTALTIFEVFLVVALATGFWTVRRAAIERAEDAAQGVAQTVARECSEAEVREYIRLYIAPSFIRQIIEGSEDIGGGADLTEQSVNDMMDKLD